MDRSTTRYTKPILVIGNGARGMDWTKFGIPIITTRLAIDLVPSDHPLFIGRYGLYCDKPSCLAVQNSDIIFCVGARLDPGFAGYNQDDFAPNAKRIVVDIDKKELAKTKADVKYNMSAKEYYHQWKPKFDCKEWLKQCQDWKKEFPLEQTGSYKLLTELSKLCDKDDIVVVDTSSSFHIASQVWQVKKGQRFITTGGISTMGYWPTSMGAHLASGRRVICITGDGCMQMNIQELATVVKNKLNIKIFILNNDGYLLIRHTQKKYFHRVMGESPETGLGFPDFKKIADAYRIRYESSMPPQEIKYIGLEKDFEREALQKALKGNDPVLCELFTPKWEKLQGKLEEIK